VTGSEELAHASRCRNDAASSASKRTVVLQETGLSPKKRRTAAAYGGETYQGWLVPRTISIEVSEWPLVPPAVLMTFARYLEHAGMQSRGFKGRGEVSGGRASESLESQVGSTIGGLHAEFSLWTTASKRTELHGEWNARPTWTKPTEVSRTRTTLAGHQCVSTGLPRPIQTCLLGGSSLVRISAPPALMSRN
jgi:hypothetical protein